MLFNSLGFIIFLPCVFILYWFILNKSYRYQNIFLLFASYFFYAFWDWRFLFLLAFSTFLDYYTGLKIHQSNSPRMRRVWLTISVVVNLGFLGFFKYYNFFATSFAEMLQSFGFKPHVSTINIILPIGISFYTFHGLSYVFDIYNKKIKPTTNFINYSLFVSFFPLLVAGPIERATHLLPQVEAPRKFNYGNAVNGLRQILWGFFKKLVIADNCAEYANMIFNNSEAYSGSTLIVGAVLFAFQIYGDFSGYSDIALGSARLLGFDLLRNFAYPYFSRDIAEFWRRWHISLSSWFKDYLYIPLGGSKVGMWKRVRNTFIIFLVSGFWHGANWTFVMWGGLNALFIMPLILFNKNRNNFEIAAKGKILPSVKDLINILLTFGLTVFAWIFFRAESITHAFHYVKRIFSRSLFKVPEVFPQVLFLIIGLFLIVEWSGREQKFAIEKIGFNWPRVFRWSFYALIVFCIGMFMEESGTPFIYFQF
jgi:D-alanyl-lipoteichoic acid acyltransferase DltB (MBOAT superfamily)